MMIIKWNNDNFLQEDSKAYELPDKIKNSGISFDRSSTAIIPDDALEEAQSYVQGMIYNIKQKDKIINASKQSLKNYPHESLEESPFKAHR